MKAITVLEERNEVKVDINTKIYNYNAVLLTIKDFLETNWVYLDGESDSAVSVFLKPKKPDSGVDLNILGLEFYNYVLGIMENGL